MARRRGDTQAVFSSYKQLADFFTGLADQRTAIYFWEKCLEITQLTSDAEGEAQATRSLERMNRASPLCSCVAAVPLRRPSVR